MPPAPPELLVVPSTPPANEPRAPSSANDGVRFSLSRLPRSPALPEPEELWPSADAIPAACTGAWSNTDVTTGSSAVGADGDDGGVAAGVGIALGTAAPTAAPRREGGSSAASFSPPQPQPKLLAGLATSASDASRWTSRDARAVAMLLRPCVTSAGDTPSAVGGSIRELLPPPPPPGPLRRCLPAPGGNASPASPPAFASSSTSWSASPPDEYPERGDIMPASMASAASCSCTLAPPPARSSSSTAASVGRTRCGWGESSVGARLNAVSRQ
eukprot:363223-Chlamydomonas_euryale.AAC.2